MQGKVIVITGAASGIGLETAKLVASKGAKVSLADVQEGSLKQAVEDITKAGGTAFGTIVDVRDRKQVEDWISATVQKYGRLDGAANIAGVVGTGSLVNRLEDVQDDDWDFVIGVNAKGVLNCLRAQIPHINDNGSIVNASSIAGVIGLAKNGPYCAAKHAVIGLTKVAAKEVGERGIRCNAITPGPIQTPLLDYSVKTVGKDGGFQNHLALKRKGDPKEVANLVDWLLSDGSTYITGSIQQVDGGWNC